MKKVKAGKMQLNFTNEYFSLFLLLNGLIIVLFLYSKKRKKKRAVKFGNYETLEKITDGSIVENNNLLLLTRILALSCLIIGISNPVLVEEVSAAESDYILAIDRSASMFNDDIEPTRFEAATEISKEFVRDSRPPTKTGIVPYSGAVEKTIEPTEDQSLVLSELENLKIGGAGGTNIAQAIRSSASLLISNEERNGKIILVTDGRGTENKSLNNSLAFASSNNIPVYSIGIGKNNSEETSYETIEGENVTQSTSKGPDIDQLARISNSTGGEASLVSNRTELRDSFLDIGVRKREKDVSNIFILLGAFILVFEWILHSTRLEVIP